ncbi:hypothetical protein, partial [Crossiella sp. NPDC003009]
APDFTITEIGLSSGKLSSMTWAISFVAWVQIRRRPVCLQLATGVPATGVPVTGVQRPWLLG